MHIMHIYIAMFISIYIYKKMPVLCQTIQSTVREYLAMKRRRCPEPMAMNSWPRGQIWYGSKSI